MPYRVRSRGGSYAYTNFGLPRLTTKYDAVLTPILIENTLGEGQGLPTFYPFHQPQERTCGYLEYAPAAKALYIYKHPCFLWDSNSGPTAPQSASLNTT
ncbi:hypothetical protein TNCV_4807251 [Trichonephila clavipes]|nr:hypothetical protein TNCV_4807251 [Trichonephila clavipes]